MNKFEVTAMLSVAIIAVLCDGTVPSAAADAAAVAQALAAGTTPGAAAANQPASPPAAGPSLLAALEAAQSALQACKDLDQKIGVSVLDSAGIPKVLLASDGATARGVQSSTNKALTALAFNTATSELGERSKSDTTLAARLAASPAFNSRAGGLVVVRGSQVIGAIGVGGAQGSQKDEACARAGLAKLASPRPE